MNTKAGDAGVPMPESTNAKPRYSKDFWEKLFDRYYHDDIIDLATKFTKNGTLKIEFADLKLVWGRIGETTTSAIEYLINNPDEVLEDANNILHGFSLLVDRPEGWSEKAHVEISGFEPVMAVRDLGHEHLCKFVSVTGVVTRVTPFRPKIVIAAYRCLYCEYITRVPQDDEKIIEPLECENDICGRKGPFKLLLNKSEFVDYQKIILQYPTDAKIEEVPRVRGNFTIQYYPTDDKIEVILLNDLVTLFYPLQKVTITGIVRARQKLKGKAKTPFLEMFIEANHINVSKIQDSNTVVDSHA